MDIDYATARRRRTRGERCKQRPGRGPRSRTYFLRRTLKERHLGYQPVTAGKTSVSAVSYPQID